jgi:hypothetical protein
MQNILQLGLFDRNISVMRLLPPEIAFRFHALPIATDGQSITVAMASPDDPQALAAIQAVIDVPMCVIQADGQEIDQQLAQLWSPLQGRPRLLAWVAGDESQTHMAFCSYLAELLSADLEFLDLPGTNSSLEDVAHSILDDQPDLFLYSSCQPAQMTKRLICKTARKAQALSYLIVPPQPIWPITKILLVLPDCGQGADLAITWAGKLAQGNHIQVTVLPVLPPIPQWYGSFLRHDLEDVLTGNDPLGIKLRAISRQFNENDVIGVYKLREGEALSQVREEIFSSHPDLIIIPELRHKPDCWMAEDLGSMLFKSISTPLLLTMKG